jgi:hypothetical protein
MSFFASPGEVIATRAPLSENDPVSKSSPITGVINADMITNKVK